MVESICNQPLNIGELADIASVLRKEAGRRHAKDAHPGELDACKYSDCFVFRHALDRLFQDAGI